MDARIRWLSLLSLLLALLAPLPAQRGDEKFSLEAKFEPASAKPGDMVTLVLSATVACGWHAYGTREKVNIPVALVPKKLQLAGLELAGEAQIPPGEPHRSAIGDSFPLPNEFTVKQTMKVPPGMAAGEVTVKGALDYQICDANMCLPPTGAKFSAKLQVLTGGAAPAAPPELGTKPPLKLVPDEKVQIRASFDPATARAGETTTLVIDVKVDERYHAYGSLETGQTPVGLDAGKLEAGKLEVVGAPDIPPGEKKQQFGMDSYPLPHEFQVRQVMRVPAGTAPGAIPVKGVLDYQVCDENSCDPATEGAFAAALTIEAGEARAERAGAVGNGPQNGEEPPKVREPKYQLDDAGDEGLKGSLWSLILLSIAGGLFALVMPCTYPMIPITFSFFTKQADRMHGKVLPLALTYGVGIVLMFVLVGIVVGDPIVRFAGHWATNLVIGVAFVVFALSLFGFFTLQLPSFITNAAGRASTTGGLLGVFLMGATLVVSSFTCTAPIVGALLAGVGEGG